MECPKCGKPLKERTGKYGDFLGCTGYPECKYAFKEKTGGYPQPSPQAPQSPTTHENKVDGNMLVLEEVQAVNARLDKLIEYIVKKLG